MTFTDVRPQSPRWLMIKGRKEEALQVLARLHARGDTSDTFVQAEYAEIEAKVTAESQVRSGWVEVSGISSRVPSTLTRTTRSSECLPTYVEYSSVSSFNSPSK
jgi:hypothetical protein